MTTAQHVIFGTCAIGLATFEALRRRGERVRLVNRSGHAPVPDDIEVVGGDARDPGFTVAVASAASVVYQTLNPPYPEWSAQFPALQTGVIAAAHAAGARLVSMENVYMYGRPDGRLLTEDRAYDAHTRKGRLRGRMATELLAVHQRGQVEVAIGRASDYFGPEVRRSRTSVSACWAPPWPAGPPESWVTSTSLTPTPTSPTSGRDAPCWGSIPTPPARSGTFPTTPTRTAPAASSSRCGTSSRNRSSWTAARWPSGSVPERPLTSERSRSHLPPMVAPRSPRPR
jgi:hypothetical protein